MNEPIIIFKTSDNVDDDAKYIKNYPWALQSDRKVIIASNYSIDG